VETTISVPEAVVRRVDAAARRLGLSRSEFFSHAAARWLDALDSETTVAINDAVEGHSDDHAFTDAAAAALSRRMPR